MSSKHRHLPLVSVYIPTKNRPQMLQRAIDSVLSQTYPKIEIVISDDGSTDNTPELVQNLQKKYSNIVYLREEHSKGACHARNKAIQAASGKFITGLDDDDRFTPERLAEFVAAWHPNDSFLCAQSFNYNGSKLIPSRYYGRQISMAEIGCRNVVGNQIFADRERLLKHDLLFDESFPAWQDYEFFTHIIAKLGPARRIMKRTYIQHTDHELGRITNPSRIRAGYRLYRAKHGHLLSKSQRLSLLVNMTLLCGRGAPKRVRQLCWQNGNFYDLFRIYKSRI